MKKLFLTASLLCLLTHPAWAQRIDQLPTVQAETSHRHSILAVINDDVISSFDLNARVTIAILSSGMPDQPDVRQKINPQIFRALVDEKLQLQEAKRLGITVSDDDVNRALDRIASDNHILGGMKSFLESKGASPLSLMNQIRASIAWTKVVQRTLRPKVNVSDDEIDAVVQKMEANAGKQEFLVSDISLPVDDPREEQAAARFTEHLMQQIKEGANFGAVARQFSQGTGAASGGDMGWIQEGQLSPEINRALLSGQKGDLIGPLRSSDGYHIIGLRDKRIIAAQNGTSVSAPVVSLQQAFHTGSDSGTQDEAKRIIASFKDCSSLKDNLADHYSSWKWQDLGKSAVTDLPAPMASAITPLQAGQASTPMITDKGVLILFLCTKQTPSLAIDRNAIMASIGTERLELQARRLLRDLRRSASISIRSEGLTAPQ